MRKIKRVISKIREFLTTENLEIIASSLLFTVIIFLLSGGLYTVVENPQPLYEYRVGGFWRVITWLRLYTLADQGFNETIFSALLYLIGIGGLLLLNRSTKNIYHPRQAYINLFAGAALLLSAFIGFLVLIQQKGISIL